MVLHIFRKKPHLMKEMGLWSIYSSRKAALEGKNIYLFSLDFDGACGIAKNFWGLPRWLQRFH